MSESSHSAAGEDGDALVVDEEPVGPAAEEPIALTVGRGVIL